MDTVPYTPGDLTTHYAARLRQQKQPVKRVVKVLPPVEVGGEVEVLFLGGDGEPLTAYFRDRQDTDGALICAGW